MADRRTPPVVARELRSVIAQAVLRYNLDHLDVESSVNSREEECASLFVGPFDGPDSWGRTRISVTVRVEP